MRLWRAMRAGLMAVLVVGLAMGGLALAQDPADPDLGAPVPSAAYERILDLLAPLVDGGTLTEDQAAAVAERLADTLPAATDHAPGPFPALAELAERLQQAVAAGELTDAEADERLAEARERIARRAHRHHRRDHVADVLVDELGVTPAELREAAEADESLADVAAAQGVGAGELVDRIVAPLEERLGDAVAEGDLTEDEAAARIDRVRDRVTDRVTRPIRDRPRDR